MTSDDFWSDDSTEEADEEDLDVLLRRIVSRVNQGLFQKLGRLPSVYEISTECGMCLSEIVRLVPDIDVPMSFKHPIIRSIVWEECNGRCTYCNLLMSPFIDFTVDHVIPQSRGGNDELSNLVGCCKRCNSRKGDRTPEEWER